MLFIIFRGSQLRYSVKKDVLKKLANFIGKHLCWSQVSTKSQALRPARNFIKKKFQHRCFPVKFVKLLRIPILKNICERLLLHSHYNYLRDFHYHHFDYHCKAHLYRLRILLTIFLDCNMIPSVSAKFCLFSCGTHFHLVYSKLFVLYAQWKDSEFIYDHQANFRCSLYILHVHNYLHFFITLNAYTYLHLLIYIYVLFTLLYELSKIFKIWAIQKLRRNFLD